MAHTLAVLILDSGSPVAVGGLTLAERAVRLARRGGLDPVVVRDTGPAPLDGIGDDEAAVVIGPDVLFEPAVLNGLARIGANGDQTATAAYESGVPLLLYVPRGTVADVRTCRSIDTMVATLRRRGPARELALTGAFCRRVAPAAASSLERAYIRHLNGKGESFFTKQIRRFSVPLTSRLVRVGASPTQVTLGGLALAVASAWYLSRGSYGAGVLGGVLYYTSMVFDCSDGEVARLTARDSAFGAWLETIVDYVTYFLVLGALTAASQNHAGADAALTAGAIALVSSALIAFVAGYLRHRVAAADPGQFDEASARVMSSATPFHRFASWSRQWIKRSTIAHLILALALVNQLPILLYLWAFGATVAAVVFLAVEPLVVRRVTVAAATVSQIEPAGPRGV